MSASQWLNDTFLTNASRTQFLPVFKENLYKKMPLLNLFHGKGRVQPMTSVSLTWPVTIKRHAAEGLFYGYSPISTVQVNPTVTASLSPAFYYATVALSLTEELQNTGELGKEKLFDMLAVQFENADKTMRENMVNDLYGAGTARGGLSPITGLRAIIDTDNTYAGIDRSNTAYAAWQANEDATSATNAELQDQTDTKYLPNAMRTMYTNCSHDDAPDVIVLATNMWNIYMNIMEGKVRTDPGMANLGFSAVQFDPASSLIYDKYAATGYGYFLTTSNYQFYVYPNADFDFVEKAGGIWQWAPNQLAKYANIIFGGQLRCDVPRQQGIMTGKGT